MPFPGEAQFPRCWGVALVLNPRSEGGSCVVSCITLVFRRVLETHFLGWRPVVRAVGHWRVPTESLHQSRSCLTGTSQGSGQGTGNIGHWRGPQGAPGWLLMLSFWTWETVRWVCPLHGNLCFFFFIFCIHSLSSRFGKIPGRPQNHRTELSSSLEEGFRAACSLFRGCEEAACVLRKGE